MKLGQNACLGHCSDEFDGSGEQSRAIMALLFIMIQLNSYVILNHKKQYFAPLQYLLCSVLCMKLLFGLVHHPKVHVDM
jgi:hypothetical protein